MSGEATTREATSPPPGRAALTSTNATTVYRWREVEGLKGFYREAGPEDGDTLLLLHGFPSSSRMFDTLIPLLADRYRLIAPDFPGFGQSDAPPPTPRGASTPGPRPARIPTMPMAVRRRAATPRAAIPPAPHPPAPRSSAPGPR